MYNLFMLFIMLIFSTFLISMTKTDEMSYKSVTNTYYVSKHGSDRNAGTYQQPFESLKKVSEVLKAGDTCIITEGVYYETLKPIVNGKPGAPIVFMAKPGDKVIISAMEKLEGAAKQNRRAEFDVDFDLREENLVLCDGEPLTLARWPNKTNNNLMDPEAAEINAEGSSPTGIVANNLPPEFTYRNLKGATVWVNADRKWSCWTSHVTGFNPKENKIILEGFGESWWVNERHNPDNVHRYGAGMFYVANAEILLDKPGEWYYNRNEKKLKLLLPEDCSDAPLIEMKRRKWAIDLREKSNIIIEGIECIGAPVTMEESENCVIRNIEIKHYSYSWGYNSEQGIVGKNGNFISGKNNSLQSCHIWGSNGDGVMISGESNTIFNCDIHDVNCIGSHNAAPLKLEGKGHSIVYNTIHDTGRDCIRLGGGAHEIAYNQIFNPGRISEDLGVLKSGGTDADNMVIHHNIISNDNGKFIGIYFDNYTNNIIAHHNIVTGMKDGIRSNRPGHFHIIFNNSVSPDINNKFGPWEGVADQFGTVIINNLMEQPIMANPEVVKGQNQIVSIDSLKFEYKIENNQFADFPDYIGAIETGASPFKAGHNFENPPELKFENDLPFVRNHLKNGCFDYARTYEETSIEANELLLKNWERTHAKNAEVLYFEGFNFPTNPEHRFSIHGNSLCLSGDKTDGVTQKIYTLLPNRTYSLSGYFKSPDKAEVLFSVIQNGKTLAQISSNQIDFKGKSNWKFVQLDFDLEDECEAVQVVITKKNRGTAYIDDVGIIPML